MAPTHGGGSKEYSCIFLKPSDLWHQLIFMAGDNKWIKLPVVLMKQN